MGKYILYGIESSQSSKSASYPNNNTDNDNILTSNAVSKVRNKFYYRYDTKTKKTYSDNNVPYDFSKGGNCPQVSNYEIDYNIPESDFNYVYNNLHRTISLPVFSSSNEATTKTIKYYNRFKVPVVDENLQRGFAHVFFVKPSCFIYNEEDGLLRTCFKNNLDFSYVYKNYPNLLRELTTYGSDNDFSFFLSNHATSFSLKDEYINNDGYGTTFSGYKIAYGRHDMASKTGGTININFQDTRDLSVYRLIGLWVKYISGMYRGIYTPNMQNIINKIIDYVGAIYYILTAEDGETIIFWSKYYGVFPTTIPSSHLAWSEGNVLTSESLKFEVEFAFSFKEDCNPRSLLEFNNNSKINGNTPYEPTFKANWQHANTTWVGTPFIEYCNDNNKGIYKLRFKPKS